MKTHIRPKTTNNLILFNLFAGCGSNMHAGRYLPKYHVTYIIFQSDAILGKFEISQSDAILAGLRIAVCLLRY